MSRVPVAFQSISAMRADKVAVMVHLFSRGRPLQWLVRQIRTPLCDCRIMGPLQGIRLVEFAAIGPVPFAAMLLSDMGAEIVRVDRKRARSPHNTEVYLRGRRAVALDLKKPKATEAALKLVENAEALLEG